jgi:GMP synthase-like glutamine amidotransferase
MRVLAIVHELDCGSGVFAEAVRDTGAQLDQWLLPEEADPPADPLHYDAVLTFGSATHPDQSREHPWLAAEMTLLRGLLDRGVPVLGVCLGAELLASAAGSEVRRAQQPEIGWHTVRVTGAGVTDPLLGPLAPEFEALEWHSYECAPPPGATSLAVSDRCLQAYRLGDTAWGIQFHAEVTEADLETWIDDYRSDPDAVAMGLDAERLRSVSRPLMASWNMLGRGLCQRFLSVAASRKERCRLGSAHDRSSPPFRP